MLYGASARPTAASTAVQQCYSKLASKTLAIGNNPSPLLALRPRAGTANLAFANKPHTQHAFVSTERGQHWHTHSTRPAHSGKAHSTQHKHDDKNTTQTRRSKLSLTNVKALCKFGLCNKKHAMYERVASCTQHKHDESTAQDDRASAYIKKGLLGIHLGLGHEALTAALKVHQQHNVLGLTSRLGAVEAWVVAQRLALPPCS